MKEGIVQGRPEWSERKERMLDRSNDEVSEASAAPHHHHPMVGGKLGPAGNRRCAAST